MHKIHNTNKPCLLKLHLAMNSTVGYSIEKSGKHIFYTIFYTIFPIVIMSSICEILIDVSQRHNKSYFNRIQIMTIVSSHLSSFSAWQSMINTYTHFLFLVIYLINGDFFTYMQWQSNSFKRKIKTLSEFVQSDYGDAGP